VFELLSNVTFFVGVWLCLGNQQELSVVNLTITFFSVTLVFALVAGIVGRPYVRNITEFRYFLSVNFD
jgi:hypothetical protein